MADQEQKTETVEEKPTEEQTPAPTTESSEETKAAAPETQPPAEIAAPPAAVPEASEKVEPVSVTGQETIAAPPAGRDGFIYNLKKTYIQLYYVNNILMAIFDKITLLFKKAYYHIEVILVK